MINTQLASLFHNHNIYLFFTSTNKIVNNSWQSPSKEATFSLARKVNLENFSSYQAATNDLNSLDKQVRNSGITDSRALMFSSNEQMDISQEGNTFNRYNWIYPDDELSNLISYVFIVRPDLNIIKPTSGTAGIELTKSCAADSYFQSLRLTDPELLRNTCVNYSGYNHDFINFLLDRVEDYQIPDWGVTTQEITQPFTNFKTQYAGNANDSLSAREFSITFRENADLGVTKFFTAWVRYMNGVVMDRFETKPEYQQSRFINGAPIIDYATSVYLLKTKPDGSEIVYFHKSTGAFPTTVPHSNWSYNKGESKEESRITIAFSGGFPEPLNPQILGEFNYNSRIYNMNSFGGSYASPVSSVANWGSPIVGKPYILLDTNTNTYRLYWESIQ